MSMFRELSEQEVEEFKKWARDNFDPSSDMLNPVWHPVVRDECNKMIAEAQAKSDEWMIANFGEDGMQ